MLLGWGLLAMRLIQYSTAASRACECWVRWATAKNEFILLYSNRKWAESKAGQIATANGATATRLDLSTNDARKKNNSATPRPLNEKAPKVSCGSLIIQWSNEARYSSCFINTDRQGSTNPNENHRSTACNARVHSVLCRPSEKEAIEIGHLTR